MMTDVRTILADSAKLLTAVGVDSPRLSAEILLSYAMGVERLRLVVHPEDVPTAEATKHFAALLARRISGEPVAYLIGKKEFFDRDFIVTPATLIPRPETESLIEAILDDASLPAGRSIRFADLGTGSGCIAVTVAAERPQWRGAAIDLSAAALAVAAENARKHRVDHRLSFVHADFTFPIFLPQSLDLFIGNPPYISRAEYETISHEVRNFEPPTALVPDGLRYDHRSGMEHEEILIKCAEKALRPGGVLFLEHGYDQRDAMEVLLKNNNWTNISYNKDLYGKYRFIHAVRQPDSD